MPVSNWRAWDKELFRPEMRRSKLEPHGVDLRTGSVSEVSNMAIVAGVGFYDVAWPQAKRTQFLVLM